VATAEPAQNMTLRRPCGHEQDVPSCPTCSIFRADPVFGHNPKPTDQSTGHCECDAPGFCKRYQREMRGRFWELCRGINVDLGTSAEFRERMKRERTEVALKTGGRRLVLRTTQAPGDTLCMTAAVYSLHKSYPGEYLTGVVSPHQEIWENNPDVVQVGHLAGAEMVDMHYPAIHESNDRAIHFMQGWCEHLGASLGVQIPLMTNRPRLYFNDQEPQVEDYWVVCSGTKKDFTLKAWGRSRYQEVMDRLSGKVKFIQVGASSDDHPPLYQAGLRQIVGKTTLCQLFEVVRRSRGVLCGITLLMHVAAALGKPAVVIAGGREPVPWNAYPKQHYLHTVGALPCSTPQGAAGVACWRGRVVPLGDNPEFDSSTCLYPEGNVGRCMTLIRPAEVADLILRYNMTS
jgi:Glycosyltransferase family 9 (heptosyltransferase)